MTKQTSPLTRTAIWRGKAPSVSEFNALINIIGESALLLDRERSIILLANSSLLKLTAFTQNELRGKPLVELIVGESEEPLNPGDERAVLVKRHNQEPLPVLMQANALDLDGQWMVLFLLPSKEKTEIPDADKSRLVKDLVELQQLLETPDLSSLGKAVEMTSAMLGCNYACIYQADSDSPQLNKIASHEAAAVFPDTIASTDLIRLSKTSIWVAGKQVNTEIHRAARAAKLSYVASTPLGNDEARSGLLVAAGEKKLPDDQLKEALELIGKMISAALQQSILVENLRLENEKHSRELAIRNQLVESAQEGILVVGPELKILEMNPAAEIMLGYADREVHGQLLENILIGHEGLISAMRTANKGIPIHNMGNISLHRRNGQSFPANVQMIPVQSGEELLAILIFITDVSEHEQIRMRTQQLEHRAFLGEFTAIFAHEVRNPINNISTGLQLLASLLDPDDPNQDAISRMQGDCNRLNHLMESVLSFSRPIEPKLEPMDVGLLLNRIIDRWRPRLSRMNVTPYFQVEDGLPKVMGDPRSLEQVFVNLISNAMEAMSKDGGTLSIRAMSSDVIANRPQIEITVSDNGPGIPDDIRDRIFEPFLSTKSGGTGLGLAISKRIITAHQGSINVHSFPGGTVFHVFLPAANGEEG